MNNLINTIIILILFYVLLLISVFIFQRKLLYHPNFSNHITGDGLIHRIEKINIKTEDNIDLKGWFHLKNINKKTILFLHGNAGSLDNRIEKLNVLEKLDINILCLK